MSDEYERLCARWDELTSARRVLTAREADELDSINTQLNAHDAVAAARSDTLAIASLSVICTDYEAQIEYGDGSGVEW